MIVAWNPALQATPLPVTTPPGRTHCSSSGPGGTRKRTAAFNANIWSLARRQGALVMDTWGMRSLRDWRMWHADRIRLSDDGTPLVEKGVLKVPATGGAK
jgi:hypothetical protein